MAQYSLDFPSSKTFLIRSYFFIISRDSSLYNAKVIRYHISSFGFETPLSVAKFTKLKRNNIFLCSLSAINDLKFYCF